MCTLCLSVAWKVRSAPKNLSVLYNIIWYVYLYIYTSVSRWERNNLILFDFLFCNCFYWCSHRFLCSRAHVYVLLYKYDPIAFRLFVNQIFYEWNLSWNRLRPAQYAITIIDLLEPLQKHFKTVLNEWKEFNFTFLLQAKAIFTKLSVTSFAMIFIRMVIGPT